VADPTDTTSRIALARDHLTAKLGELRRREARVRRVLSRIRQFANPWLGIGVAAFIGYRLGRPDPTPAAVEPTPARSETLVRAVVRASLVAVAQAVVRDRRSPLRAAADMRSRLVRRTWRAIEHSPGQDEQIGVWRPLVDLRTGA
jgi:hypothetical protein